MLSSMNTVKESLEPESTMESSTMPQYSGISEHSSVKGTPEHIREWLMLSLEASRVSPSAMQGKEQEKTIAGICGEKPSKSYVKYDPDSRSWRMSQGFFPSMMDDISDEYLQTWARAGTMSDGECYRQPKWELRTNEIGSGLRATPTQHGNYNQKGMSEKSGDGLATQVKKWATPNTMDGMAPKSAKALEKEYTEIRPGRSQPNNLRDQVSNGHLWAALGGTQTPQTYPTPTTVSGNNRGSMQEWGGGNNRTRGSEESKEPLNPNWVEWLMGWTIGWTDLKPLEMDKFQSWLRQHGGS